MNLPLLQLHLQHLPAATTSLIGVGSPTSLRWLRESLAEENLGLPLYLLPLEFDLSGFGSVAGLLMDESSVRIHARQDMARLERVLESAGSAPFLILTDPSLVQVHYAHIVTLPAKKAGHVVITCNARPIYHGPPRDTAGITYPGIFFRIGNLAASFPQTGDYLEFGVFDGRSMTLAWQMMKQVRGMRFFGFDSFSGIQGSTDEERFQDGTFFSNLPTFLHNMTTAGADLKRVVPVPGEFSSRLIPAKRVHAELGLHRCLVAHIDCDVYEAAKPALDFCTELLVQGSILLFDEFHANQASNKTGERRALREWLEENTRFDVERWHDYGATSRAFIVHEKH